MYFKDTNGGLHFFSQEDLDNGRTFTVVDGEQVEGPNKTLALLPTGSVQISDQEAELIKNPPESGAHVQSRLQAAVQAHLDAGARALGYDDIKTAVTYADEPAVQRFQAEGLALRAWRSRVWAVCYTLLGEVEAGTRPVPTSSELLALLPQPELPT